MIDVIEIAGHHYISAMGLSKKFGVHRTTIRRWANEQGLPFVKIGHTRLFAVAKLADWLEGRAG